MIALLIASCYLGLISGVQSSEPTLTHGMPRAIDPKNLTLVTWAHAVNSRAELQQALDDGVDFIECDIVYGVIEGDEEEIQQPIMGHPPANTSDISLDEFLRKVIYFNANTTEKRGLKLDFKSTEVFNASLPTLELLWPYMTFPVWINADILPGPVFNNVTLPVDASFFLSEAKRLENATLSIGWTTKWSSEHRDGSYTDEQVSEMLKAIADNEVQHPLTFPVRAGIAANSRTQLRKLISSVNDTNTATFTIWSSKGDYVDIEKLQAFILDFGVDKVYLDVPEEVSSKLNLASSARTITCAKWINVAFLAFILYKLLLA